MGRTEGLGESLLLDARGGFDVEGFGTSVGLARARIFLSWETRESVRKDVEWAVVARQEGPGTQIWSLDQMWKILNDCVIMHNMTV